MTVNEMLRLIAGSFIVLGVVLGITVSHYFFYFAIFVGLNLVQSSFTGWCPMMTILRRAGFREG